MKKLLLSLIVVAASVSGIKADGAMPTNTATPAGNIATPAGQDAGWSTYVSTKLEGARNQVRGYSHSYPFGYTGIVALSSILIYKACEYLWNSDDEDRDEEVVEVEAATDSESLKLIATLSDEEFRQQTQIMKQAAKDQAAKRTSVKKPVTRKK